MSSAPHLDRRGGRRAFHCSTQAAQNVRTAAQERGLTQRIVVDEMLEDEALVKQAAARAAAKLGIQSALM